MKRASDIVVSGLLLLSLAPLLAVITVAVWSFLGSPAIFSQTRPGLYGRPFRLHKFRTMKDLRDAEGHLLPDDERSTCFGRYLRSSSLDELPELWNVLKGDMSLVGPRPLLMQYMELYTPNEATRHAVKPGITGWAQVNGRNALQWEDRFKYDVWYVQNRSTTLDLKILLMTIVKVLTAEGVSPPGQTTMAPFTRDATRNPDHSSPSEAG